MLKFVQTWFFFFCLTILGAQRTQQLKVVIPWLSDIRETIHHKEGFGEHPLFPGIPVFSLEIPASPSSIMEYSLQNLVVTSISLPDSISSRITNDQFLQHVTMAEQRGKYSIRATILPLRKTKEGSVERLQAANLTYTTLQVNVQGLRSPQKTESVLAKGSVYKIAVSQTGVHKLDKSFLETKLGLPTSGLDPRKIRMFGARGGKLPESNAASRTDDLDELAISVTGEEDGRLDENDQIQFYAEGPDIWKYDAVTKSYSFDKNIYDQANYYFIVINGENGLRISTPDPVSANPEFTTPHWERLQRLEDDKVNLLGSFIGAEGTGKDWYGDYFNSASREKNLAPRFNLQSTVTTEPLELEFAFAGRSKTSSSFSLVIGNKTITRTLSSVNTLDLESLYARRLKYAESFIPGGSLSDIRMTYPVTGSDAEGWLDYLQIVSTEPCVLQGNQLNFRNRKTIPYAVAAFTLENTAAYEIWDVTNPLTPQRQTLSETKLVFRPGNALREFTAFNKQGNLLTPTAVGKIPNQNLHGIQDVDMAIVYHPLFAQEALRLAEHREAHSGLKVAAVEATAVYNEFAGGKADPAAIRDFARMLYDRNEQFSYLLLFGDGSYDYKGLVKDVPAENLIPSYQTDESLHPIDGFPSDDFYGLLGPTEGSNLIGDLDIYVGRLPARTAKEATVLVDKIIHYDTSPECFGDWRLRAGYVADDEDGNTHLRDMDEIARLDETRHPKINQQKVYIDAYKQVSTPGENRYPDVNKSIYNNIYKGQLTLTYLGHGGPLGWAQERILTVPELQSWTNYNQLPVMITATCSFGAYDEPAVISPAEYALANPNGGAIALMTTTRAVYTNSNKQLTDAVHEEMFKTIEGKAPTLGYIMAQGKNKYKFSFFVTNSRKFTLLGDPSLAIALPTLQVVTSKVNQKDATTQRDTIHALEKVTVEGIIAGPDGNIATGFQGTIFPTVFDKKTLQQTLANDESSSRYDFTLYRNIIFKGAAAIINGKWSFSFWVPKNINYSVGAGRISYYATNGVNLDATGYYDRILLGGSSQNPANDDLGPEMKLFMNNDQFVDGGITNANPILLVQLQDDLGIDVTGNAIGQDITATLDGNSKNQYILNDFYNAEKDNFTKGTVRFPLTKLTPGEHVLDVKAWDISGNSTTGKIRFVVADPATTQLENARCIPNPFTDDVRFQFEHDLSDQVIQIEIIILDATGKLVKKFADTQYSDGFRVNDIVWIRNDSFEQNLPRGLYFVKMTVTSADGKQKRESRFLKLLKM